jgi:hypothetical protein
VEFVLRQQSFGLVARETGTQIGSDIPARVVAGDVEAGMGYPMDDGLECVFERRSAE